MAKMVIHTPDESDKLMWPNITILGVDPSMTSTGWSVTSFQGNRTPRLVSHGNITTEPTGKTNMEDNLIRMNLIFDAMKIVASAFHYIDAIAIELPVPARTGTASQAGSMSCVAVNNVLARMKRPTIYIHPTHSKKVTTGDGKASKAEVKEHVVRWIGGNAPRFNQDVSDSISASICTALDIVTGRVTYTTEGFTK